MELTSIAGHGRLPACRVFAAVGAPYATDGREYVGCGELIERFAGKD